jgi:hypothetical protein
MDQIANDLDSILTKELIELLYQGILKRDPDPSGLYSKVERLEGHPTLKTVFAIVRGFVLSPENIGADWIKGSGLLPPPEAGIPVSHIVSIGTHCATAQFLKLAGVKKYSGPFDWIFSNLSMVADCLENDFEDFLNREYYVPVLPDQKGFADHSLYKARYGIGSIFNHSNPLLPEVYEYTVRCVKRFRRMLTSDGRKVLFCLSDRRDTEGQFTRLHQHLDERYSGCELFIVKVEAPSVDGTHGLRVLNQIGAHRLFSMTPTARCGPLSFPNGFDDLVVRRLLATLPLDLASAPD